MNGERNNHPDPRDSLLLKLPEPKVSAGRPWNDDLLNRGHIAERLTNIVRNQSAPFTVSIHGGWGTGKTFLLKRWQQDLENKCFSAIYFNAWEDDFCDDPLLAILGQLHDHFKARGLRELTVKVIEKALPLLVQNALGVLNKTTGLTLDVDVEEQRNLVEEYLYQRASKDELKERLAGLAEAVLKKTGHPLVFIIDELDRCRPTFAVELLERVKHVFDVPKLVFVFGINRDELCASLRSIYGEIDADVYLRRFFDMEFVLPEADSAFFCRQLMEKLKLPDVFVRLSNIHNQQVHHFEVQRYLDYFPKLWARMGLSLRDVQYCVRSLALVGRNVRPGSSTYPWLLGLFIPLKLKNLNLYRQFVRGGCHASKVMDYIDGIMSVQGYEDDHLSDMLDMTEVSLYRAEYEANSSPWIKPIALNQLDLLASGRKLEYPEYLSDRTKESDEVRINRLAEIAQGGRYRLDPSGDSIGYIAGLIDLHQSLIAR